MIDSNRHNKQYLPSEMKDNYLKYTKQIIPLDRMKEIIKISFSKWASDIHIQPIPFSDEDVAKDMLIILRIRIDWVLQLWQSVCPWEVAGYIRMWEDTMNFLRWLKWWLWAWNSNDNKPIDKSGMIYEPENNLDIKLRYNFTPTGISNGSWYYMKVCIRILENKKTPRRIWDVGLLEYDLEKVKTFMKQKQGFMVVAWPTGSWKSTTLAWVLDELNEVGKHLLTFEDPIEYENLWMVQSKINKNPDNASLDYQFKDGMRAAMRQDPDIILIWETRDKDTAEWAIEAQNTWHLVFTTVHANSSTEIFQRFWQMWVALHEVANGIHVGFSQRLLRRTCNHCSIKREMNNLELEELYSTFLWFDFSYMKIDDLMRIFWLDENWKWDAEWMYNKFKKLKLEYSKLEKQFIASKKEDKKVEQEMRKIESNIYSTNELLFDYFYNNMRKRKISVPNVNHSWKEVCPHCLWEWYAWRVPIFEVVKNDEELQSLIMAEANKKEMTYYVESKWVFTLKRYAFLSFLEWNTSFDEVLSVV